MEIVGSQAHLPTPDKYSVGGIPPPLIKSLHQYLTGCILEKVSDESLKPTAWIKALVLGVSFSYQTQIKFTTPLQGKEGRI